MSWRGRRELLNDAGPQGSALSGEYPEFTVAGMAKATLHNEIDLLASGYDDIVIDGPPRAAELAKSIILAANLVVIPLQPSPLDVWEASKSIDLIREAPVYRPTVRCCLAINRRVANKAIGREVRAALAEQGVPVLKNDIGQRIAFAESAATGSTVLGQKQSKAAKEIKKFVDELSRYAQLFR